jgi:acetylornithine deacetylase/succinyl-diaminopimelate desuccinylase-like protein
MRRAAAMAIAVALNMLPSAMGQALRPDRVAFRALYRELVEIDTSAATGNCTLAAERMRARLRAAGFGAGDVDVFVPEGHARDGGLIARIKGSDPTAQAMLLVDHIDVVTARREDWSRDPFRLVEEGGYFIARGVIDDKALSAIWVDSFIRLKREGFRPRRTIKLALSCGEESGEAVNGVAWLLQHRREAVSAAFALNEGGYGITDGKGRPLALYLAVGEKHSQNFTIEARNPGGHSSRPRDDNALYDLADALGAIRRLRFPIRLNATNQGYFAHMGPIVDGEMGRAMAVVGSGASDPAALAIVTKDVTYNAMLRTTCVATMAEAGHAPNALPQRARATIQCRLFPGEKVTDVEAQLRTAIGNPAIILTQERGKDDAVAVPPPLDPAIIGPAEEVARAHFPGIPVVPNLLTAGTDGRYLSAAGIPTYGAPGIFLDPDGNGAHGVNERIRVKSVYEGRDYLHALLKRYAMQR